MQYTLKNSNVFWFTKSIFRIIFTELWLAHHQLLSFEFHNSIVFFLEIVTYQVMLVGKYEYSKKDFLGKGGFGSVYVGRNIQVSIQYLSLPCYTSTQTGRQAAIKVINNYYLNQNQMREIDNLQVITFIWNIIFQQVLIRALIA